MNTQSVQVTTLKQVRLTQQNVKQSVIALQMDVQESAVSKIENKAIRQLQIDKLTRYIEAMGGTVNVSINMPDGSTVMI